MNYTPLLDTPLPIVAAPMAGGPTTPALVTAVAGAGRVGVLAGGYPTRDGLAAQIAEVREHTDRFGVNLFVPSKSDLDRDAFRRYAAEVQVEADAYGLELDPDPVSDDDHWEDKLGLLIDHPVPVVSLTFALPDPAAIAALQRAGSQVLATVTTPGEALEAQAVGVDGLIVQGPAAGGHSATYDGAVAKLGGEPRTLLSSSPGQHYGPACLDILEDPVDDHRVRVRFPVGKHRALPFPQ